MSNLIQWEKSDMNNRKVTGILSHIWNTSSQIWRLWCYHHTIYSTIYNHLVTFFSYSLRFGDYFPLLLCEWRPPTMTTHNIFNTLVKLNTLTTSMTTSQPHHCGDLLLHPTLKPYYPLPSMVLPTTTTI